MVLEGRIHQIGTLNELKQNREGPFADLMREYFEKKIENLRKKSRKNHFSYNIAIYANETST